MWPVGLGPQLVALFGGDCGTFGRQNLVKRKYITGNRLWVFLVSPLLPVHPLCIVQWFKVWALNLLLQPPCLPLAAMLPRHDDLLAFWSHNTKQTHSSISCFGHGVLSQATGKLWIHLSSHTFFPVSSNLSSIACKLAPTLSSLLI